MGEGGQHLTCPVTVTPSSGAPEVRVRDPGLWLAPIGAVGMYRLAGPPHPPSHPSLHPRSLILTPSAPTLSLRPPPCPPPSPGFPTTGSGSVCDAHCAVIGSQIKNQGVFSLVSVLRCRLSSCCGDERGSLRGLPSELQVTRRRKS